MTIEEKAKAYDEAIERGKQIQNTPYTAHWDIMKEVAEHLLPELKGSEDERIRKELLDFCKSRAVKYPNDPKYKNISAWIAWLEKQREQKPAWSEEDEDMLNLIISRLHSHPNIDLEEYSKEYGWLNYRLEFLRPQNRWKPSDEQLEALKNAIHIKPFENPSDSLLWGLYEQLKKLREE